MTPKRPSQSKRELDELVAWARLQNLGLGREQLAKLAPMITTRLIELAELWALDVDGIEMAIGFHEDTPDDA